jgi:hypothetical protein
VCICVFTAVCIVVLVAMCLLGSTCLARVVTHRTTSCGPHARTHPLCRKFYEEIHTPGSDAPFKVRGPSYLSDGCKVAAVTCIPGVVTDAGRTVDCTVHTSTLQEVL